MTIEEINAELAKIDDQPLLPPNRYIKALRELRDLKQRMERLKELAPELTDDAVPETMPELYAEYMALLGIGKGR